MKNADIKDTRILEAFDYIDPKYIAEVAESLKLRSVRTNTEAPKMTWRTPLKHWKQFVALAACLILLSMASPIVNYVVEAVRSFAAGWGSGTTESSETLNTLPPEPINTDPYSISQEELNEINAAWAEHQKNENSIFCENIEELKYLSGYCCFYGKYNGCIVLFRNSVYNVSLKQIVNGYVFELPRAQELWVCKDSTYYSLNAAYENGWLTDENIEELYNIHNKKIRGEFYD